MPKATKELQREYARKWIAARRASWFAVKCCEWCGSIQNLELDHIDPATKVDHKIWSWSLVRREAELAKCRPLCRPCHQSRSTEQQRKPIRHGQHWVYAKLKCRCEPCRKAHNDYNRNYYLAKKADANRTA